MFGLYLLTFVRIVLGIVFIISFFAKLINIRGFKNTLFTFDLLGRNFNRFIAWGILFIEFFLPILLLLGGELLALAFILAFFLLLSFTIALATVLARKMTISCNCFGYNENSISIYDIFRNSGLILCSCVGFYLIANNVVNVNPSLSILEWCFIGFSSLIFVCIWLHLKEVIGFLTMGHF